MTEGVLIATEILVIITQPVYVTVYNVDTLMYTSDEAYMNFKLRKCAAPVVTLKLLMIQMMMIQMMMIQMKLLQKQRRKMTLFYITLMMDVIPKTLHQMTSLDFINQNLLMPLYAAVQPLEEHHAPLLAIAKTLVIL